MKNFSKFLHLSDSNRDLATDQYACIQTQGMGGFKQENTDSLEVWAAATTANATSCQPLDPHGFALSTRIICGKKYWIALRKKSNTHGNDYAGDLKILNTSSAQDKRFSWIVESLDEAFEAEGLLLEEDMAMYASFLLIQL